MTIPDENHPGWLKAISGQGNLQFESLATKVIMGRLNQDYKRDAGRNYIFPDRIMEKTSHRPRSVAIT
jgi:hypothetical protein